LRKVISHKAFTNYGDFINGNTIPKEGDFFMSFEIQKVKRIDESLLKELYGRHYYNGFISNNWSMEMVESITQDIIKHGVAFELREDGQPLGFISAYKLDKLFYGQKGYYTPELGWMYNNDYVVLNLLLKALLADMAEEGYTHHAIGMFYPDNEDQWFNYGYGIRKVDVSRKIGHEETEIALVNVKPEDIDVFYPLYQKLEQYMMGSPIFLTGDDSKDACEKAIKDKKDKLFFLKKGETILGFTTLSETEAAGSPIFKDDKTMAIKGTYILEQYQGQGYGEKALCAIMNYSVEKGFEGLSTDFESYNLRALRFWPRFFAIAAKTFVRYIGTPLKKAE